MNQRAFPQAGVSAAGSVTVKQPGKAWRAMPQAVARRRRRVFQVSKKPSNVSIFLISFLTYLIGIFPSIVFALPTGGTVQAGSATIDSTSSQLMTIYQTTEKAIIDWQTFSIESAEHVDFQLSQGGVTLNRITGDDPSNIFGKLTSNGDLWLINPNGILFGASAQVDVHGLIATTSDISNTDFMNGNYNFGIPSSLSATVVNQGSITAAEGGLVALVAPGVQNSGIITARLGKVSLVSGITFTVDLYGDQLINLGVESQVMGQVTGMDGQVLTSLVSNSGSIFADGGLVRLDVNAAQNIVDGVINMDGIIQARSVVEKNGQIILSGGDAGEVSVTGTLDASGYGEGETGGTVHVLGEMLSFDGYGIIDISGDLGGGTLLFGGDYQGQGSVPNAADVYVGSDTQTFADAVTSGNGGKVIFWADRRMRFYGIVKGRGGQYFGDGGLVEVSGKEELYFDGSVDTTAANGKTGTLLLDPDSIFVEDGTGATASGAVTATISVGTLEGLSSTTNIQLLANNLIKFNNTSNINLQQGSGNSATFTVTNGDIIFASNTTLSTNGGDIIFNATGDLDLGTLVSNGGDIVLSSDTLSFVNLGSGAGDINITHFDRGKIGLGTSFCGSSCDITISSTDLANMTGNKLIIGGTTNGDIYVDGFTQDTTSFANGVELKVDAHLSGSNGAIVFESSASSFSALTASAVNGIEVNSDLTTTVGSLALDGDSDNGVDTNDPVDNISFVSGITLTSAGDISLSATNGGISAAGALTLTALSSITLTGALTGAGDISLSANSGVTLNSGISTTGSLTIEADADDSGSASTDKLTLAGGINLSAGGALSLDATTGGISGLGNVTLTSTGSSITVTDSLTALGAVTMTAASGLTLSNSTLTGTGDITLQGGSALSLASGMNITSSGGNIILGASGGSITANNGALTLSSNGSITVSNSLSSVGAVTMTANSGITLASGLTATGAVALDADLDNNGSGDFTISSGTLSTGNNALTITANDLTLTGSLNSGTGSTTINVSDGGSLGIGFSSGFGMNIDDTELGNISKNGDLNLVNSDITFSSISSSLSSLGKLTIGQSGGTITGQGALTLSAAKGLDIASSITSAGNLILEGDSNNSVDSDDSISLASGVLLTSSAGSITLDATTGGISAAGATTLSATNGININDNFTSAGATTIDADTYNDGTGTFTVASALSTGNNALAITAGNLALSGTLSSGTAGTTILASQAASTIGLGTSNCGGTCGLSLTSTELGKITAGSLTIGDGSNRNITVEGVSSADSDQFGLVTLNATASGSSVTFETTDSFFQGLTVNAADGITISSNLTTNGTTSFNSDSNATGIGDFILSSSLSTTNNALSVTANGLVLTGTLSSGTAGTTILASQATSTIGLGASNCGGTCGISLTSTELASITAGSLIIGDGTNGNITVEGVSSTDSDQFGALTLNATASGSSFTFETADSFFQGLTVNAADAINISSNLTTLNLTLDGGTGGVSFGGNVTSSGNLSVISGGAITDTGVLTIAGTSSFTTDVANQTITLDNTSNSFTGAVSLNTSGTTGNATLVSNSAVTLPTSTVGGNLDITVGGGNSLNVTGAGSAGGSISLLADDDIIFTASGDLTTTGNITVNADNDGDENESGGALTMVDGTVFDAGSGTLALSADEDITLGLVKTTSSSDTAVTLISTNGGVVDADAITLVSDFDSGASAALDIDAKNGRLVAEVATGFGSANAIETEVKSVNIVNSTSGDIDIFEFDDLDVFTINNSAGDVQVSFGGGITGKENCVAAGGTCKFLRRDIRNKLILGTGKNLGQLVDSSINQATFDIFDLKAPDFQGKTPVDLIAGSPNGPFTMDVFSESFELVELAEGTSGKFDGMEVSQAFWGGEKNTNLEVAKRKNTDKKSRSRQRSAKRKKLGKKKVGETASITLKNPRRIQTSESGYLGFAPPPESR